MNSFETDLKRAVLSGKFAAAVLLEAFILWKSGPASELFRVCVPVLSAFPYAAAWISDLQSGYIKIYLPRCGLFPYIQGKFFACGISGGLAEVLPAAVYNQISGESVIHLNLLFAAAAFWACFSAVLAAVTNSRYIAYGGSFVICYILVILKQRYFDSWYTLYPFEWVEYQHSWMFGKTGIFIMIGAMAIILNLMYTEIICTHVQRS